MSKSFKFKNNMYLDTKGIVHNKELLSDVLNRRQIYISSRSFPYNTNVMFFTLPYSAGVHSYIITGVISYVENVLYDTVMLLVTQTGTNVKINRIIGNTSNEYTANGINLNVKNMQAQSNLHLYGVCYILR